jgi:asparagine N-glycosylation enzyme membrane subunit Stt3
VIAEGTQIAVLALAARSGSLALHAAGLAATAALLAVVVPELGPPVGGPWSSIALSHLQPTAVLAAAAVAIGCAALERVRPARSAWQRAARGGALALATAGALLAIGPLRDALAVGLGFVGKSDPWAARNAEQLPLLRGGAAARLLAPLVYYGGFAYAIPLVPLAAIARARDPRRREPALVLAGWSAGFGLLAMLQVRYGNEFAAPGAIAFALALDEARRFLVGRFGGRPGRALALALAVLLAGPLVALPAWRLPHWLARPAPLGDPLAASADGSLRRFGEAVRAATPEAPGFSDPTRRPSYGILCPPNIGHALRWSARRAMVVDNFGSYLDPPHFAAAQGFYATRDEAAAAAVAEELGAPWVVTMEFGQGTPGSVSQRLQRRDGRGAPGVPALARFRLVTEGPAGGRALTELFGVATAGAVPYKLWEVVAGAHLEVVAPPGAEVEASVPIATPAGRRFRYRAIARADADGVARLRVPYATEAIHPVRALGRWRIRVEGALRRVEVSERAVREGGVVVVGGSAR